MTDKNQPRRSTTGAYLGIAAGLYLFYLVYRMLHSVRGNTEPKHLILSGVLALFALVAIVLSVIWIIRARPRKEQPDNDQLEEPKDE